MYMRCLSALMSADVAEFKLAGTVGLEPTT